jgi:hypothetical protein
MREPLKSVDDIGSFYSSMISEQTLRVCPRENRSPLFRIVLLGSAMIHAVLDKTYRQHQASACRYAGKTLQYRIVDGGDVIGAAAGGDRRPAARVADTSTGPVEADGRRCVQGVRPRTTCSIHRIPSSQRAP